MKCKYCGCFVSFVEWFLQLGRCIHCQWEVWDREYNRNERISKEYWERRKVGDEGNE